MALSTARSRDMLESWVEDPLKRHLEAQVRLNMPRTDSALASTPRIIGLYGVPGSGKSYQLAKLKTEYLHDQDIDFYEGTEEILSHMNKKCGAMRSSKKALDYFLTLSETLKTDIREAAIKSIVDRCLQHNSHAIVTGHYMFWSEFDDSGTVVCTPADLESFTNIIYLDPPADVISRRRHGHTGRSREAASPAHLQQWKEAEIAQLKALCLEHNILFTTFRTDDDDNVLHKMLDFHLRTETENNKRVIARIDTLFTDCRQPQRILAFDADETLAPVDTGTLLWSNMTRSRGAKTHLSGLADDIFGHHKWGYSYDAFRQAALRYANATTEDDFDQACDDTAQQVELFSEIREVLKTCSQSDHLGAIILTCGLQVLWQKVLRRAGLDGRVTVIGTGPINGGCIVTPSTKAKVIDHLKSQHNMTVWAFGDSPLDLPMLRAADKATVVVIDEEHRSRSMEVALNQQIESSQLIATQWLLPNDVKPRLDLDHLSLISDVNGMLRDLPHLCIYHATGTDSAKLLQTPMRDQRVIGVDLQKAHKEAGRYLAQAYLPSILGVAEESVPHVQGKATSGYCFNEQESTTIVAMMRGGLSMAQGVQKVLRNARMCFTKTVDELTPEHLNDQTTVLLVDSVINTGKSIVEFVDHIRSIHPSIRIVVVAGVVQADAVSRGSAIQRLAMEGMLTVVALRISENKYTGTGGIDTGNRLFRTTHMV